MRRRAKATRKPKWVLDSLGFQIKDHWKMYRPKMYAGMEEAGTLDQSVYEAQERTGEAHADLIDRGMDYHTAWELIREEWAFLRAEEDDPRESEPTTTEEQEEPVIENPLDLDSPAT